MQTTTDTEWADAQIEAIEPTRKACEEFDASEDGARFLSIVGMTMSANLGASSLPWDAEEQAQ